MALIANLRSLGSSAPAVGVGASEGYLADANLAIAFQARPHFGIRRDGAEKIYEEVVVAVGKLPEIMDE